MTHIVVVNVNESSNRVITGINVYDRANGGVLQLPSGSSFPSDPQPDEIFWRLDENRLYVRDDTNSFWVDVASTGSFLTSGSHKTLRQLIHFIEEGPGDGFSTAPFRERVGIPFTSRITWWESGSLNKRIFQTEITRSGVFPVTEAFKIYDTDGSTVLSKATDVITYANGCFEVGRTRTFT